MFDLSNRHLINKHEINDTELINTEDSYYHYYIDFLLSNFTKSNSSDHAIYVNTNNYENSNHHHNHQHHNRSNTKNAFFVNHHETQSSIHKLKRFAYFLSFFILFILVIKLLAKLYACAHRMKCRKKRYGYYLNFKIETYMSEFRNKLKYKQLSISNNLLSRSCKGAPQVSPPPPPTTYPHDSGHINESYEPNLEQLLYEEPVRAQMTSQTNRAKKKANFLATYLETKRINSFEYEQFIDDDSESRKSSSFLLKHFKRPQLKHETSLPLFTISKTNQKFLKKLDRSTTSFISFNKSRSDSSAASSPTSTTCSDTNSVMTNSTASTTTAFEIPVILITDTNKMQTSVVDLETFEPETHHRPHGFYSYRLINERKQLT